jgi:hypothetical protein
VKSIIKDDRYDMTSDNGVMWYYCTVCESADIARGDNFCCNCGSKIEWRLNK